MIVARITNPEKTNMMTTLSRSTIWAFLVTALLFCVTSQAHAQGDAPAKRPNILLAIADDWGLHAGAYGTPVVKTPTFDRLAREGARCDQAYVSSPSCTPSRGALLTGQYHWRLKSAANLWSIFPDEFVTYPDLLAANGYFIGKTGKAWGPGRTETRSRQPAGQNYPSFAQFLAAWNEANVDEESAAPFCFWLGTSDPHRPYQRGSGEAAGMDLSAIDLPAAFPDNEITRGDVADYFVEVQRYDKLVGDAVAALEQAGILDNTIIVMTSDHGMPFPRGKSNIYDLGVRVPLAIRWPGTVQPGTEYGGFVSLTDLAPTFLHAAGVGVPQEVTGKDLAAEFRGEVKPRDHVVFGKERHVPAQEAPDMGGYPCRGIRTADFLYISNFRPDRWPNGTPDFENATIPGVWYGDTDNGPTKTFMVDQRDNNETTRRLYELAFGKRPAEELYDLRNDPDQMNNIAADPAYADKLAELSQQLTEILTETQDPRVLGHGDDFETHPYFGRGPRHPSTRGGN